MLHRRSPVSASPPPVGRCSALLGAIGVQGSLNSDNTLQASHSHKIANTKISEETLLQERVAGCLSPTAAGAVDADDAFSVHPGARGNFAAFVRKSGGEPEFAASGATVRLRRPRTCDRL